MTINSDEWFCLGEEKAVIGEGHILGFGGTDYVQFLGLGGCSWTFAI